MESGNNERGWKLVYVGNLEVKSELPSVWKKIYMNYIFVVRKIIGHTCIFFSYCIVLPLTILVAHDDELEYIENLDPARDAEMLRSELPMIRDACLCVLYLCTAFLKEVVAQGLCLAEIGEMMSREFRSGEEEPSELEVICTEARRLMAEELSSPKYGAEIVDDYQFDIDFEGGHDLTQKFYVEDFMGEMPLHYGFGSVGRMPLFKLEESIDEVESEGEEKNGFVGK